jgi:hypothetical protein
VSGGGQEVKQHIDNTRRQLGELGAMAAQNEAMERKILKRAEDKLSEVEGKIDAARAKAMAGTDDDKAAYTGLVTERGHLHQVIAQAKQVLA